MTKQPGPLTLAAAVAIAGTLASPAFAQEPKSVRIGYAVSLSGVNAQGAAITTLSGYKLWVDDVNKKRRPAGQGVQQADSDRGHRIRRHQQRRERRCASPNG